MKENNDFFKLSDISDENLKKMYVDKLSQMYKKDMSLPENYENIKNNTNKNKSLTFPITWENDNAQKSLGLTLHKTVMSNAKINEDGSFSVFPTDIPDYDHLEQKAYKIPNVNDKGEKLSIKDKAKEFGKILGYNVVADINNNALQQQEKEQYLKYLLSTDITYTKEEIEEILKRFKSLR